jgi:DNA-binding NarL/FixJ family response regulator
VLTYVVIAAAVVVAAEAVVILRLSRALRAVARFGERLAHLTSALELLTDTTEAGLASVAQELERHAPQRAARTGRGVTARRIAGAARRGRSVEEIAASEGLSESEVRLHLQLTQTEGGAYGALRG